MRVKPTISLILFAASVCWGQGTYKISLRNADPTLALASMAAGNGVLYVAYRSSTWLRRSDKLQVKAYDLNSQKELRNATIAVPEVHGARAADGLYLSGDGQVLAYAELHDPCLLLLISTNDLTELRRSTSLPFVRQDPTWPLNISRELFAGFDKAGNLSFTFDRKEGMRFVRIAPVNLKVVSNRLAVGLHQARSQEIVWFPVAGRTWTFSGWTHTWEEYSEDGTPTGQALRYKGEPNAAVVLGDGVLLAYFGMWQKGMALSYHKGQQGRLPLACAPYQYGTSNDPEYAGAFCQASREQRGGWDKTISSEFLLLKTDGPSVVWREKDISFIDEAEIDKHKHWEYYQKGNPLIYRDGKRIYVVAISNAPELKVYVVPVPE